MKQHTSVVSINNSIAYSQWVWNALVHNSRDALVLSNSTHQRSARIGGRADTILLWWVCVCENPIQVCAPRCHQGIGACLNHSKSSHPFHATQHNHHNHNLTSSR